MQRPSRFLFFDLKVHFVPHKDDGQLDGDRQHDGQRAAGDARHHIAEQRQDHILAPDGKNDRIPLTASTGFRTKPTVHGIFPFESGIVVEIFTKYYYFEAILYKPSSQGM